ncbi:hypothetical protein [Isoptericola sp. NPDC057653]|uniref:hypothetical protein n=1 Tax=unclassified Isoptericola TaxID=2623355 RepID=UPI0036D080D3
MTDDWIYLVTDIETDGPHPGANSLRSFASVAARADGTVVDEFEAVLEPLPGAAPNPDTLAWFRTQPASVWAAATEGARPIPGVMAEFTSWARALGPRRVLAAAPLAFDGTWIDYYLRRFTPYGLCQGPYEADVLFTGPALCLRSYAAAVLGLPMAELPASSGLPEGWLGDVEHTHRAIDDARGFAHLLGVLTEKAGAR